MYLWLLIMRIIRMYKHSEHVTWQTLITERKASIENEACELYLEGLDNLELPITHIPDISEINQSIKRYTNWQVVATNSLIKATEYYRMLANCEFPAVTSVRPHNEIDFYRSAKPDVIHEYFGHGPFLTNVNFTNFMQRLSKMALNFNSSEQVLLARLFWFTLEFGLIKTSKGLKVYGAGIIPSKEETQYALIDREVDRREFNLVDILRTTFSATEKQKIYYIIPSFDILYSLSALDINRALQATIRLGSFKKDKELV